jgi:hypothetical protein
VEARSDWARGTGRKGISFIRERGIAPLLEAGHMQPRAAKAALGAPWNARLIPEVGVPGW